MQTEVSKKMTQLISALQHEKQQDEEQTHDSVLLFPHSVPFEGWNLIRCKQKIKVQGPAAEQ